MTFPSYTYVITGRSHRNGRKMAYQHGGLFFLLLFLRCVIRAFYSSVEYIVTSVFRHWRSSTIRVSVRVIVPKKKAVAFEDLSRHLHRVRIQSAHHLGTDPRHVR